MAEFTLLQNQYSAEFGHSAGGQFNTVIKNGTNDLHGSLFEYLLNRISERRGSVATRGKGLLSNPRYDNNRFGGDVGGPIRKNKLFYYGLFEDNPVGYASTLSQAIDAPTAAGYQMLATMPGVSQTNLGILEKYLPPAPVANERTTPVGGANIPLGVFAHSGAQLLQLLQLAGSIDYTLSSTDQLRARYVSNRYRRIDTTANLPAFWTPMLTTSELVSLSEFHTFRPNVLNELRLAYSRFDNSNQAPNVSVPGSEPVP